MSIISKLRFWKDKDTTAELVTPNPDRALSIYKYPSIDSQLVTVDGSNKLSAANITPKDIGSYELAPTDSEVQATSLTRFFSNEFNPYDYTQFRELQYYDEPSFYNDYDETYKQNPFSHMVINYPLSRIWGTGFHVEGPGAKNIDAFMEIDGTKKKIKAHLKESMKMGNGFLDFKVRGKKLILTRNLVTNTITVELDKDGNRVYKQNGAALKSEYIWHYTMRDNIGSAYGMSMYRPNLIFLTALYDCGGDIMAALKRTAYSPVVAYVDLNSVADEKTKKAVLTDWQGKLNQTKSATMNYAMDNKHKLELLGQGAAGAKLLPTNDLIEPIIAIILMNFGIPLGMYLQTGANKSIIEEQRSAMNTFYEEQRMNLKMDIEEKIFPLITSKEAHVVFNKPSLIDDTAQSEFKTYLEAIKLNVISPAWFRNYWDITDDEIEKLEKEKINNPDGTGNPGEMNGPAKQANTN